VIASERLAAPKLRSSCLWNACQIDSLQLEPASEMQD